MPTSHFWREWEGHTIAGNHRLVRLWGSTEQSAVFASEKDAVKLISPEAAGVAEPLDRFARIRHLSHPNLLPLREYGTTVIDGQEYYYVVTEQANDELSKLLAQRPLTSAEAQEVFAGILSALQYVHEQGFVHGAIKPPNVLLIEEQLKISSDSLQPVESAAPRVGKPSPYDPPEFAAGEISTQSDMWMLGVLLYESLTLSHNLLDRRQQNLAEPFDSIVSGCLRKDPSTRLSIQQVRDLLDGKTAPDAAPAQQAADPVFATIPNRVMPPMSLLPRLLLIAAAVVVAVACYMILGRRGDNPQAASPAPVAAPPAVAPTPPADESAASTAKAPAPARQHPSSKKKRQHRRHK